MDKYFHLDGEELLKYLPKLGDLKDPPKSLFIKGNWRPDIFVSTAAVVGSRQMTNYGRLVVSKLVPQLIASKKTIISGFMYGIDQCAHDSCIENGGKTVAVLGYGIETKLDGIEKKLADKIVSAGGLVISEWRAQKSALWTFPVRNRIVAALSDEIYVVEAAIKSGSLLTAEAANRLKRKVYAIPGPINSRTSQGTNNLIAERKATMWMGKTTTAPPSTSNDPIVKVIENESLSADEIAKKLAIPIAKVGAQLSLLTVMGQLVECEGKYFLSDVNKT